MKLWEAILIGCDKRAQAFGGLFQTEGEQIFSCALGAAIEGAGFGFDAFSVASSFHFAYPILRQSSECPERRCGGTVQDNIIYLNDKCKWSRERIALEYVKPLEESLEVKEVNESQ